MNKISFLLSIFFISGSYNAFADVLQHTYDDLNCPLTPQIIELKPQPDIVSSNNLRRFSGTPHLASGDLILIKGQILDSNCVPVPVAVIEIWQANSLVNEIMNTEYEINNQFDPNFVGSGKTTTDNMGNYMFFSIMPGSLGKNSAPHINFMVRHRDFLPFETKMYFENQSINSKDTLLNKYVPKDKRSNLIAMTSHALESLNEDIEYKFNITLEGANRYLRY